MQVEKMEFYNIEEIAKKLKPIYGKKVDMIFQAWLIAEPAERIEYEQYLKTLYLKALKDERIEVDKILLFPPSPEIAKGEYPIGKIGYNEKEKATFGLRENDWIKHIAIFGNSGSGKTNLAFLLVGNLLKKKKPFLIFDWKRNYRDLLNSQAGKDILTFTVGKENCPFRFNPLIPPKGTPPKTWLKKLIEILGHAYFAGEGVFFLLQQAIDTKYKEFGVYEGSNNYPTFKDVLEWFLENKKTGRMGLWHDSSIRILGSLTFGGSDETFNSNEQISIARQCELLGLARSSYYYQAKQETFENELYMKQHGPTRVYYPYIFKTIKSEKLRYSDRIIWFDLIETNNIKFLNITLKYSWG